MDKQRLTRKTKNTEKKRTKKKTKTTRKKTIKNLKTLQYFKFVRAAQRDSAQCEYESSKAYKLATLEMHLLKLQLTPKMVAFQVNPPT